MFHGAPAQLYGFPSTTQLYCVLRYYPAHLAIPLTHVHQLKCPLSQDHNSLPCPSERQHQLGLERRLPPHGEHMSLRFIWPLMATQVSYFDELPFAPAASNLVPEATKTSDSFWVQVKMMLPFGAESSEHLQTRGPRCVTAVNNRRNIQETPTLRYLNFVWSRAVCGMGHRWSNGIHTAERGMLSSSVADTCCSGSHRFMSERLRSPVRTQ